MKHPWRQTGALLAWFVSCIAGGMLLAAYIGGKTASSLLANPWVLIPVFVGVILLSAFLWMRLLRKRTVNAEAYFATAIGVVIAQAVIKLFQDYLTLGQMFVAYSGVVVLLGYVYYRIIRRMQESWFWTVKYAKWSNLFLLIGIVAAAVLVAVDISPLTAIILLALIAVYDAIMVWKVKKMQEMARGFLDRRILPGIAIPYPYEVNRFALLGGGDVFFIVLVAASFYKTSPLIMVTTALCMSLAVILLFFFSSKEKSYPAIPYIFVGMLAGLGLGVVLL